jgi:thioesterase domain-containing protein
MEMARLLAAQGEQVAMLALIETWAHRPRHGNLRYHLRRFGFFHRIGLGRTLRHGARLAARAFGRALPAVAPADVFAFEATKTGALRNREHVYNVNTQATRQHRSSLEPYPGRVTLFFRENYEIGMVSPEWGFEAFAQEVETRLVPGDHRSVLKEPHVRKLAEEIRFCLERAQAEVVATANTNPIDNKHSRLDEFGD